MFRESVRKFMRDELAVDHARFEKQGKVDKETWKKLGATAFIVSSDQGFLRAGAAKVAADFAAVK